MRRHGKSSGAPTCRAGLSRGPAFCYGAGRFAANLMRGAAEGTSGAGSGRGRRGFVAAAPARAGTFGRHVSQRHVAGLGVGLTGIASSLPAR
jgi:hypothetical protein